MYLPALFGSTGDQSTGRPTDTSVGSAVQSRQLEFSLSARLRLLARLSCQPSGAHASVPLRLISQCLLMGPQPTLHSE